MSVTIKDRERAVEKQWASAEDEKLLRRLLVKLRAAKPAAGAVSDEQRTLDAIVDKYKVTAEDKAALLSWRHSAEH